MKALFLCLDTPPPPESLLGGWRADRHADEDAGHDDGPGAGAVPGDDRARAARATRRSIPYGLVLDWYDVVGRYRTIDDLGKPVDGTTTLPPDVGGETVHSAVELAEVLSKSNVFMNCMSRTLLKYGLTDSTVELPIAPPSIQRGCAAAGVANAVQRSSRQSFSDMVRAVASSPAFVLRKQVQ